MNTHVCSGLCESVEQKEKERPECGLVRKLHADMLLAANEPLTPRSPLLASCLSTHGTLQLLGLPAELPEHPTLVFRRVARVKVRESESPKVISPPEQVCIKF